MGMGHGPALPTTTGRESCSLAGKEGEGLPATHTKCGMPIYILIYNGY